MSDITRINDHDEQIFQDLRRHHLRHPGIVAPAVVKLLRLDRVYQSQIDAARLEWLKLGLDKPKAVRA